MVNGNEFELEESQVFIYYDDSVNTFSVPDCLGTLISTNYVLTGASCFINVEHSIVVRVLSSLL